MSSSVLGEVWTLPIDATAKLILAFLADGADRSGECQIEETKDLADMCGRSPKTVRRALNTLSGQGYLQRHQEYWRIKPWPGIGRREPAAKPKVAIVPGAISPPPADEEPPEPELPSDQRRLYDFCDEWGVTPDGDLVVAWAVIEKHEAKYNTVDKHSDGDKKWQVAIESMDSLLPQILHGVKVFQARTAEGLPNHATSPAEFVSKQLWLAPEYQVSIESVANPPPPPLTEEQLDAMVMEMNRKGGPFACRLLVSSKNPDTGEIETETLDVYRNRVLGKYDQFMGLGSAFQE